MYVWSTALLLSTYVYAYWRFPGPAVDLWGPETTQSKRESKLNRGKSSRKAMCFSRKRCTPPLLERSTRPAESALLSSFRNCMNAWNVAAAAALPLPSGCAPSPCSKILLSTELHVVVYACTEVSISIQPSSNTQPTNL